MAGPPALRGDFLFGEQFLATNAEEQRSQPRGRCVFFALVARNNPCGTTNKFNLKCCFYYSLEFDV